MIAQNISKIYYKLKAMGLTRSKRSFSRHFLQKGKCYLRNVEQSDRLTVPLKVLQTLRSRLAEIAKLTPSGISKDLEEVVAGLDRDCRVAKLLGWR
jgi:hypothetical protein